MGTNFKCMVKGCGMVFPSKNGICAHVTHGHKKTFDDNCYKPTTRKPSQKKQYVPKRTKKTKEKVGRPPAENGVIRIPVTLEIPFSLGAVRIVQ